MKTDDLHLLQEAYGAVYNEEADEQAMSPEDQKYTNQMIRGISNEIQRGWQKQYKSQINLSELEATLRGQTTNLSSNLFGYLKSAIDTIERIKGQYDAEHMTWQDIASWIEYWPGSLQHIFLKVKMSEKDMKDIDAGAGNQQDINQRSQQNLKQATNRIRSI
jgi:hypothetical protein